MKKLVLYTIGLFLAVILSGCEKGEDGFICAPGPRCFAPRDVDYVWVHVLDRGSNSGLLAISILTDNRLLDSKTYPACHLETWMQIDDPIPQIEAQSWKYHSVYHYLSLLTVDEMVNYLETATGELFGFVPEGPLYPKLIEYRTEGITGVNITSDRELFGKQPGKSLNDHFCAATWRSNIDVVSDYSYVDFKKIDLGPWTLDSWGSVSLNGWLSCKPLFPHVVGFNTLEPISAEDMESATITVEMTTTRGKRFRASQKIGHAEYTDLWQMYRPEFLATRHDE